MLFAGQWAPIVGTGLAALGSLYVLLAVNVEAVKAETNQSSTMHHCNCSHHHLDRGRPLNRQNWPTTDDSLNSGDARTPYGDAYGRSPQNSAILPEMQQISTRHSTSSTRSGHVGQIRSRSPDVVVPERTLTIDVGGRRKVAKALTSMGNFFGTANRDWFDDSEFRRGKALDFPEIPGEEHRNRDLPQIREQYNQPRDSDGNVTPMRREARSRASSFHRSATADLDGGEGSSTPRRRRDTLEVPSPGRYSPTRNDRANLSITRGYTR